MAITDTDKQKYTRNLAPLEFSGSKKELSSWKITCLVVNVFNLIANKCNQYIEIVLYSSYRNIQSNTTTAGMNTYPSNGKGFPKSSFPRKAQMTIQ